MIFLQVKKKVRCALAAGVAAMTLFTTISYPVKAAGNDFSNFPESYRPYLQELSAAYPNWTFEPMDTGLDWSTVVAAEEKDGLNLVSKTSTLTWRSVKNAAAYNSATGTWVSKDNGGNWIQASDSMIKYALDPRNYLNVRSIFIFQQDSYQPGVQTIDGVNSIIKGTFMENGQIADNDGNSISYAQAIMNIAEETKLSPYKIAVKIRQEQGVNGTSSLISGSYGGYAGYYNYFNIKASGTTSTAVIVNGLKYAMQNNWDTPYKSILGGAYFLVKSYIGVGQDTLYLQKFDVDNSDGKLYWHQYAQNVLDANGQAVTLQKMYATIDCLTNSHVFRIPIYSNMPETAYEQPSGTLGTPKLTQRVSQDLKKVDLSWTEISGASGYTLQRADSPNGTYTTIRSQAGLESTSYTDTDFIPGNTYYYRVRAYYRYTDTTTLKAKYILSAFSDQTESEITVLPVTNLTAVQSGVRAAKISWKVSTNADGYRIYRSATKDGSYELIKTVTSRTTKTFSDTGLLPKGTYYYQIEAYKTVNGTQLSSGLSQVDLAMQVSAPALNMVSNKVNGTVKVSWTPSDDLTGYRIYRSDSKEGAYTSLGTMTEGTISQFIDENVVPNTIYYYKIAGIYKTGGISYFSVKSDPKSVSTRIWKPAMDSVVPSGKGSLTVTWTKRASRATGFAVYRSETETGGYRLVKKLKGLEVTTYKDTELTPGKTYYYKVRAYMTVGDKTYYSYYPDGVSATVKK